MQHPGAYISGRENLNLSLGKMLQWIVHSVAYAAIVFFLPVGAALTQGGVLWSSVGDYDGKDSLGLVIFTALIVAMQFRVALLTASWTRWSHFFFWLSNIGYLLFCVAYNFLYVCLCLSWWLPPYWMWFGHLRVFFSCVCASVRVYVAANRCHLTFTTSSTSC